MTPKITKNTLSQILARVIHIASSFIVVRIIIEALGKDGYGAYGFITATVLMFATIADWGIQIIAIREASQNQKDQGIIFSTSLLLRVGLAILTIGIINIVFRVYPSWVQFRDPATIASLVLLFLALKNSLLIVFQTKLYLERVAAVEAAGSIFFVVLTFLLLNYKTSIDMVMVSWVGATAVSFIVGYSLVKKIIELRIAWSNRVFFRLFKESLPVGASLLIFSVYNRIDIIILERFHGVGAVAVYDLAYRVHGNLVLGAAFLMNALFPVFSRLYKEKDHRLRVYYEQTFGILALVGIATAGVFWVLAGPVVYIFAGQEYLAFGESITAIKILVFATLVAYLNHLTGYGLIAFGKQHASLIIGSIALLLNLSLNIILIPLYSFLAAGVVTVGTELFVFLTSSFVIWRTLGIFPTPFTVFQTLKLLIKKRGKIF